MMIKAAAFAREISSVFGIEQIYASVILGSGLGRFAEILKDCEELPYDEISGFPQSSVSGHKGSLILGKLKDKDILCFSGRFHFYEGFNIEDTILPVQIAKELKAQRILISNAAGGIDERFRVGDLMLIQSAIRWISRIQRSVNKPFISNQMNEFSQLRNLADTLKIPVQAGNYIYVTGPNYESPAEIRAFRAIGAHAVGMSTYAEIMEAEHLSLPYAAISLISNMAAGMSGEKLDHSEIKAAADARMKDLNQLVGHYLTH